MIKKEERYKRENSFCYRKVKRLLSRDWIEIKYTWEQTAANGKVNVKIDKIDGQKTQKIRTGRELILLYKTGN